MMQRGEPNDGMMTVRELALLLRDWLSAQLEGKGTTGESLGTILGPEAAAQADQARQQRTRRFREALAGMESLLLSDSDLDYKAVLDHVMHNVGASLQAVGLIGPEGGLVEPPLIDLRHQPFFPAVVELRRYVALPTVSRTLHGLGIGQRSVSRAPLTAHLVEYYATQPRLFRGPRYSDERFGLFMWGHSPTHELLFIPTSRVPDAALLGGGDYAVLAPRPSFLSRLLGMWESDTRIARLAPRDFTALLRALLLDYEALQSSHQRELADRDQLGSMLWSFLTREE